jgi:coenzyme PQQ precursor peptide PqqA
MLFPARRRSPGAIVEPNPQPRGRTLRARRIDWRLDLHPLPHQGDFIMKWETPAACDFRFGFEITMYIAAR